MLKTYEDLRESIAKTHELMQKWPLEGGLSYTEGQQKIWHATHAFNTREIRDHVITILELDGWLSCIYGDVGEDYITNATPIGVKVSQVELDEIMNCSSDKVQEVLEALLSNK